MSEATSSPILSAKMIDARGLAISCSLLGDAIGITDGGLQVFFRSCPDERLVERPGREGRQPCGISDGCLAELYVPMRPIPSGQENYFNCCLLQIGRTFLGRPLTRVRLVPGTRRRAANQRTPLSGALWPAMDRLFCWRLYPWSACRRAALVLLPYLRNGDQLSPCPLRVAAYLQGDYMASQTLP